jgi:hypothetical protein
MLKKKLSQFLDFGWGVPLLEIKESFLHPGGRGMLGIRVQYG